MEQEKISSREYMRVINTLYYALILGQVIFAIISFVVITLNGPVLKDQNLTQILVLASAFIGIGSFYANRNIYKQKLDSLDLNANLQDKLIVFRSTCIVRWAILEAPSFLSIIGYFLTGDILFLAITGSIIFYFLMIRLTPEKICNDLKLDEQDKLKLMDPDSLVY